MGIAISLGFCKEKSLWIFRELDLLAVTGGSRKRWVGGIITTFYFMVMLIIVAGFMFHWIFYNRRIDSSEITALTHQSEIPESFKIELMLYSSRIVEDHTQDSKYTDKEGGSNGLDLCAAGLIEVIPSPYFERTEDKNLTC